MPGILENATSELVNAGQNNQVPTAPPPAQIDIDSAMKSPIFKTMLPETQQKFLDFATKQNQQSQKEAPPMTTDQWAKLRSGGGLEQSGREPTYNERSAVIKQNAGQPLNFFDRVKAIGDDPAKLVPFVGDAVEMNNIKDTIIAAYSYQNGTANDEQMNLLKQYAYKTQIEHANSDFGYKVMNIFAGMPAFVGELVSTAGIGNLVKNGVYEGGLKVLKDITEKKIMAFTEGTIGKTIGKTMIGAAAELPGAFGFKIGGDALQKLMPDVRMDQTQHDMAFNMVNSDEHVLPAVLKSFGGAYVDLLSQRTAGIWDTGLTTLGKEIAIKTGFLKSFLKINPDATIYTASKLLQKVGWSGIIPQMIVTEQNKLGRASLEGTPYKLPTPQELGAELVAFSIPAVAENYAKRVETKVEAKRIMSAVDQKAQANEMENALSPQEKQELESLRAEKNGVVNETTQKMNPHLNRADEINKMASDISDKLQKTPPEHREEVLVNYENKLENTWASGDHHMGDVLHEAILKAEKTVEMPKLEEIPKEEPINPAEKSRDDAATTRSKMLKESTGKPELEEKINNATDDEIRSMQRQITEDKVTDPVLKRHEDFVKASRLAEQEIAIKQREARKTYKPAEAPKENIEQELKGMSWDRIAGMKEHERNATARLYENKLIELKGDKGKSQIAALRHKNEYVDRGAGMGREVVASAGSGEYLLSLRNAYIKALGRRGYAKYNEKVKETMTTPDRESITPEQRKEMSSIHELIRTKVPGGDEAIQQLASARDSGKMTVPEYIDNLKNLYVSLSAKNQNLPQPAEQKPRTDAEIAKDRAELEAGRAEQQAKEQEKVEEEPNKEQNINEKEELKPTPKVELKAEEKLPPDKKADKVNDRVIEEEIPREHEEVVFAKEDKDFADKTYKDLLEKGDLSDKEQNQYALIERARAFAKDGDITSANRIMDLIRNSDKLPDQAFAKLVEEEMKIEADPFKTLFHGEQRMNIGFSGADLYEVGAKLKEVLDKAPIVEEIKNVISPTSSLEGKSNVKNIKGKFSERRLAEQELRESLAGKARENDVMMAELDKARGVMEKLPIEATREITHMAEKGEFDAMREKYGNNIAFHLQDLMDRLHQEYLKNDDNDIAFMKENYLAHLYEKGPTIKGEKEIGQMTGGRSLPGKNPAGGKRYFPTLQDAIKEGYVPITENPVVMTELKLMQMRKYRMAKEYLDIMRDEGLMKWNPSSAKLPEDWVRVSVGEKMRSYKTAEGKTVTEVLHPYANKDIARIINNYLSPGLQGSKIFQAWRQAGNFLNQAQLGLSAFHLGFTSIDAMVSKLAVAMQYAVRGDLISAAKRVAEIPLAPITNVIEGDKVWHAWYGKPMKNGKDVDPLYGHIADMMKMAGGRAEMAKDYSNKVAKSIGERFKEAFGLFKKGQILSGVAKTPIIPSIIEGVQAASKPIMEYLVPRQKMGVFADMMKYVMKTKPNLNHEQLRAEAQKAWDSVDNRMGQLVYDNLFWNRTFKDILMASVRSVGWNLGTIREIGGGIADLGNLLKPKSAMKEGETKDLTYRSAYIFALPMLSGLFGAMYQFLRTQKLPGQGDDDKAPTFGDIAKDLYFPRTGRFDRNGDPERVSLPTYMKDLYHYKKNAVNTVLNKVNPAISFLSQLFRNKDFYGVEIVHHDDPNFFKKLAQVGTFAAQQVIPFGFRNVSGAGEFKAGKAVHNLLARPGQSLQNFVGITPAPFDINKTKAENTADQILALKQKGMRTSAEFERAETKKDLRQSYLNQQGDFGDKIVDAIQNGKINQKDISDVMKPPSQVNLSAKIQNFSLGEVLSVERKGTMEEKDQLKPLIMKKYSEYMKAGLGSERERQEMTDRVIAVVNQ